MVTTSHACRRLVASLHGSVSERASIWLLAATLASCSGVGDEPVGDKERVSSVAQALDTDSDGMDDAWETTYFGDLSQAAGGDFDSDGMTNVEEYSYGFIPNVDDAFDDADGDRYPNVFEVRRGSDPNSSSSLPTANYTVNGAGGGTHTTIGAAVSAANVSNGAFQIIAIAAGTYKGNANLRDVTVSSTKPKILFIGLDGSSKTIIDGEGITNNWGWTLQNSAVVSSLTIQKATNGAFVDGSGKEVRFVDVVLRDNVGSGYAGGVNVNNAAKVSIVGSTFLDNTSSGSTQQIWFNAGAGTVVNTVVWSTGTGTMLAKASGATMTTNYDLVKGQTLTGTGNLAGSVDPKLRSDLHLLWDSPLRAAGGTIAQSRIDIDGELRPSTTPDIGVDQFLDSDSDDLADQWEMAEAGDLTTLTSRSQDADSDGLTNEQEYAAFAKPTVSDTDGDGLSDGDEVNTHGTSPLLTDTDADDMPDGWEVTYGLSPVTANGFEDADGDRYPNVFEYAKSTDPSSSSSVPTANYTVNGAGGGTHTTIGAAVTAANVSNGNYQIIAIAAGTYKGAANLGNVTVASTKPKLLFIGLDGAAKTILDGELITNNYGWTLQNAAVVSSLTFQKVTNAIFVDGAGKEVRCVDLIVRDNVASSYSGGVYVNNAAKVHVVGSTFFNNTSSSGPAQQIWFNAGAGTVTNTVVWSTGTGTMLAKASGATMTTNYDLVKGQTLTGTGNLAGSVDPKLRSDLHLLWDSPLRAAGGTIAQSRVDLDGELRPSSTPDIGVDQFLDSDSDQLADQWELAEAGNLTTLTSLSQDADSDGLTNELEYAALAKPTVADTDGDGVSDGAEVNTYGTSPLITDTDGDDMPDGWEITYGLSAVTANAFDDADGDRYPNVFEYARSSDPSSLSSTPTANYTVNGAGGGTHTTIGAAVTAANVSNGNYQIIAIAPGTYKGNANLRDVTVGSTKPKLLFIGLDGAAKTVIDGELITNNWGWTLQNSAVVSSLTIQRATNGAFVDGVGKEVRFVDVILRDNVGSGYAGGVNVYNAAKVVIAGSTFFNNTTSGGGAHQIWFGTGTGTVVNTVVWSTGTGTMLAKASGATMTTNYDLVKGQTLTGIGNLAGSVDAKLRPDLHLLWDSPLRAAGGTSAQSRIDLDGELRPSSTPDIGVDQFLDSDSDQLADQWEVAEAGDLTTLTSRSQDADSDGLTNDQEYAVITKPTTADTDGDGLADGAEVNTHGTNPLITDTDGDDMPDGWEVTYGLAPLVADGFDDADGDRYPNVFEYVKSTDPTNISSIPTANYTVDGGGGGTHTTIGAAIAAADVVNGHYQIIAIAAGTYKGVANLANVTVAPTKPKLLFIGLDGAAKTIIDGELITNNWGWTLQNSAVISSLTFQKATNAIYVDGAGKEVRCVDLIVRDNVASVYSGGVYVNNAAKVSIVGSTFSNNTSSSGPAQQIWFNAGAGTVVNTVVWSAGTGTMLGKASGATMTTNYDLVKGQTLTGTGNLAGTLNPEFRSDLRIRSTSPLRGAGGSVVQSRIDVDGELRPSSAPDIGVDQFNDVDSDGLADSFELATAGNTTSIAGAADEDDDGLSNAEEYDLETIWNDADTDGDGLEDGFEVSLGMNPFVVDSDDMTSDVNHDGLIDSLTIQVGYSVGQLDNDGDSISNDDELLMCTNPFRADTDGDGVADGTDAFPLDPLMSALPSDPEDVTGPVITLVAPWFAVEQ